MSLADKIVLQQGDLTEMDVDAVVNPANSDLQLGGGLAGVIRRRAGESIQRECNQIGSVPVGGAALTSGGKLKARHIIHAASMELGGHTECRSLRMCTAHSLRIAAGQRAGFFISSGTWSLFKVRFSRPAICWSGWIRPG